MLSMVEANTIPSLVVSFGIVSKQVFSIFFFITLVEFNYKQANEVAHKLAQTTLIKH